MLSRYSRAVAGTRPGQGILHRMLGIHHAKLQGRRGAQDLLCLGGVLHAGQLHDDAVAALLLNDRLGDTELVDPVAQGGDVLLQRETHHFLDGRARSASPAIRAALAVIALGDGKLRQLAPDEVVGLLAGVVFSEAQQHATVVAS